jgi:hypothetical protein
MIKPAIFRVSVKAIVSAQFVVDSADCGNGGYDGDCRKDRLPGTRYEI